jgi:hypothetical protein
MTRLTLVKVLDAFRQYVEETDARLEKLESHDELRTAKLRIKELEIKLFYASQTGTSGMVFVGDSK